MIKLTRTTLVFWREIYIASIRAGNSHSWSLTAADEGVAGYIERLNLP